MRFPHDNDDPSLVQWEPVYKRVGETLYRHSPSGGYYGLIKRSGKQFRRSPKSLNLDLAIHRLPTLRKRIGKLIVDLGEVGLETDGRTMLRLGSKGSCLCVGPHIKTRQRQTELGCAATKSSTQLAPTNKS